MQMTTSFETLGCAMALKHEPNAVTALSQDQQTYDFGFATIRQTQTDYELHKADADFLRDEYHQTRTA